MYIYIYIYVCVCVCVYVCTYVCACVYVSLSACNVCRYVTKKCKTRANKSYSFHLQINLKMYINYVHTR